MGKVKLILIVLLFAGFQAVMSQAAPGWSRFQHLKGHWVCTDFYR